MGEKIKGKTKTGCATRTHPEKSTDNSDMYNRALPFGTLCFSLLALSG
ncbi:MAG: hypothetical protein V8R87_10295 [Faecalibacterium prausnitzii]